MLWLEETSARLGNQVRDFAFLNFSKFYNAVFTHIRKCVDWPA